MLVDEAVGGIKSNMVLTLCSGCGQSSISAVVFFVIQITVYVDVYSSNFFLA